jgi:hypothetical protein
MMNKDFKRLGDLVAGTIVVYDEHTHVFQKAPEARPEAFPIPLSQYEQHAVVSYAERSQMLSEERLEELANILTPITNQKDRDAKNAMFRFANWLLGRR